MATDEDKNGPYQRGYRTGGGLVPIPDPTKLTLEVVALAKKEIEKLFDTKISSLDSDVDRIEKVISEISGAEADKREQLKTLIDQKFVGVATEFTMRDIALAAAFKAAEAIMQQQNASNTLAAEKLAVAFTKQIDNLNEKIDGLKEQIGILAGKNWATVGAYIVGAIGIAALIITVLLKAQQHANG